MLKLFSPAKINLFLRIVGKRPDGYHDLSSLFQTINLGDTLSFELSNHDSLTCTDPIIPTDETNLVLKAARLFRNKTGMKSGLKVHLKKIIPIQAGLGGGSSNAATTLWAFNQLAGNIATTKELQTWSAEIGSDIPFFFSQGTAYCTGRGEHVQSLDALPEKVCWIIKPNCGLSTPEVYKKVKLRTKDHLEQNDLARFISKQEFYNDLEQPAFEVKPELSELKEKLLRCGFDTVLLSGSGSAFFCLGNGEPLSQPDLTTFFTKFNNRTSGAWY